jgi:hypothetical protein
LRRSDDHSDGCTAAIVANDDPIGPINGTSGDPNVGNAFDNDLLNGAPVNPADITATVTTPATPINGGPVPMLNTTTGVVSVPAGTPAGVYTIAYQICENLNPSNCDEATITVTVVPPPIVANDDPIGPINGTTGDPNVGNAFDNDLLNGAPVNPADITATVLTPATPINGGPVPMLNTTTGMVSVPAGTPAGTYTIAYQICENLNPSNCDVATITVTVEPPVILAEDDSYGPINGTTGDPNVGNAFDNDELNGAPVVLADITATVLTPATPINGAPVPVLDPMTGIVSVPAGTPAGTYTINYQICENLNPSNCDDAVITVTVVPPPIVANDDTHAPVSSFDAHPDLINVLANDSLNNMPVNIADITVSVLTPATPQSPGALVPVLNPTTGFVSVPQGTPAGMYTIEYQICENLNPTNCDVAIVTITVFTPCFPPTNLGATMIMINTATLTWNTNNPPFNPDPTDHCWRITLGGVGFGGNIAQALQVFTVCAGDPNVTIVGNTVSVDIVGLQPGTCYEFTVSETCDGLVPFEASLSDVVLSLPFCTFDTPPVVSATATAPECPEGTPGFVPNGTITVNVMHGSSCQTGLYDIEIVSGPYLPLAPLTYNGVNAGNYTFTGAGPGTYTIRVSEVSGTCNQKPDLHPVIVTVIVPNAVDVTPPSKSVRDLLSNEVTALGPFTLPEGVCGKQVLLFVSGNDSCDGPIIAPGAVTATAVMSPSTIQPGTQVFITDDGNGTYLVDVHFAVGITTLTIGITDASGNVTTMTYTVEVFDNIAPVVQILGNSQFVIPSCETTTTGTVTVLIDDACDQFIDWNNLVFTISNGATFVVTTTGSNHRDYTVSFPGPGTYIATATYTDATGNTGTVSKTFTVESVAVNNPPTIYPNAETVTLSPCEQEKCFTFSFLIEDDCEAIDPAQVQVSGLTGFMRTSVQTVGPNTMYFEYSGCLPVGVYFPLITYQGITANPTITVLPSPDQNQPADIVLPAINVTIPQCDHIAVVIPITITDDCDDPIDPARAVFTLCGEVITPSFVNAATGYFEFAITLTAAQNGCLLQASYTDGGGLTSASSTLITVSAQPDTWAPVIVYPSQTIPVVLNECNNGQQEVCFYVTATDNCDGDLIPTVTVNGAVLTPQAGTNTYCYLVTAAGTYTVLMTATDAAGNVRTEDFLIEAVETPVEPVNLACVAVLNTTLNDGCEVTLTAQMLLSGSFGCLTDADFEIVVFDGDPSNGPIVDGCGEFMYEIRLRPGVDGGDFTVCWGTVRSEDKTKPELTCPADTRTATVNREVQVLSGALTTSDASMDYTLWPCFLEFVSQAANPGLRYYDLFTFTVSQTDVYTFEFESNLPGGIAPGGNGMAALFASATFNPLSPCQNIIYQNDQVLGAGGGIFFPNLIGVANVNFSPTLRLALPLQAGQTYTLYTTSTVANATGNYTWAFYSDNGGRINGLPLTAAVQTRDLICNDGLEVLLSEPATYYTDRNGNITSISPALNRILGYTGFPTVSDNCGNLKITVTDVIQFSGTCTDVIIRRTFRVEDKQNSTCTGQPNVTECVQEIRLRPARIADVLMPPFTAYLECDESYPTLANGNPSPAVTGYPFIETAFGFEDLNQSYCNLSASFFDYPAGRELRGRLPVPPGVDDHRLVQPGDESHLDATHQSGGLHGADRELPGSARSLGRSTKSDHLLHHTVQLHGFL